MDKNTNLNEDLQQHLQWVDHLKKVIFLNKNNNYFLSCVEVALNKITAPGVFGLKRGVTI